MGKMSELSIMSGYDDARIMMCEKEDLIQYLNYIKGELKDSLTEELEEIKELYEKELRLIKDVEWGEYVAINDRESY